MVIQESLLVAVQLHSVLAAVTLTLSVEAEGPTVSLVEDHVYVQVTPD